jgi:hypothetical protein
VHKHTKIRSRTREARTHTKLPFLVIKQQRGRGDVYILEAELQSGGGGGAEEGGHGAEGGGGDGVGGGAAAAEDVEESSSVGLELGEDGG